MINRQNVCKIRGGLARQHKVVFVLVACVL